MQPEQSMKQEIHQEAVKSTIAVSGAGLSAMTLNEWVALATLIYIVLQIGLLIPKYWKFWKGWIDSKRDGT